LYLKNTHNIVKKTPFVDKYHPFIKILLNKPLKSGV